MSDTVKLTEALSEKRSTAVRATVVRGCKGNANHAMVVQQLKYWMPRATKSHLGHKYVFKTYEEFGGETGMSPQQVRRALTATAYKGAPLDASTEDKAPKDKMVIAICNPYNKRDKTLWWRINPDCELSLEPSLADQDEGVESDSQTVDIDSLECRIRQSRVSDSTEHYQRVHTESTPETTTAAAAGAEPEVDREVDQVTERDSFAITTVPGDQGDAKGVAGDASLTRVKAFVKRRAEQFKRYRFVARDEANPEWHTAIGSISATDDQFDLALETAFSSPWLADGDWLGCMRGDKAAQGFARDFHKLLTNELPRFSQGKPPRVERSSSGRSNTSGRAKQADWRSQPKSLTPEQAEAQAEVQANRERDDARRAELGSMLSGPCPTPGCVRITPSAGRPCSVCERRAKQAV
jgi:hypothetical protein